MYNTHRRRGVFPQYKYITHYTMQDTIQDKTQYTIDKQYTRCNTVCYTQYNLQYKIQYNMLILAVFKQYIIHNTNAYIATIAVFT